MNWQSYSAMCIAKGIENPYQDEAHYNRAYGISESRDIGGGSGKTSEQDTRVEAKKEGLYSQMARNKQKIRQCQVKRVENSKTHQGKKVVVAREWIIDLVTRAYQYGRLDAIEESL